MAPLLKYDGAGRGSRFLRRHVQLSPAGAASGGGGLQERPGKQVIHHAEQHSADHGKNQKIQDFSGAAATHRADRPCPCFQRGGDGSPVRRHGIHDIPRLGINPEVQAQKHHHVQKRREGFVHFIQQQMQSPAKQTGSSLRQEGDRQQAEHLQHNSQRRKRCGNGVHD